MDLAKFISLLSKDALYFACPCEFDDPFEGYFPKSWVEDQVNESRKRIEGYEEFIHEIASLNLKDNKQFDDNALMFVDDKIKEIDYGINGINTSLQTVIEENISQSGVSCWHKSEHESEAMWKLYSASGQGIAIESSIGRLNDSIINKESLEIKSVEYISEDEQKKEYGKHDPLFLKRKSFEHEKELRAIISLKEKGKGTFVECDLDKLISRIHISPLVEPYFKEIVEKICAGKVRGINKPVTRSTLFDKPNYEVTALALRPG